MSKKTSEAGFPRLRAFAAWLVGAFVAAFFILQLSPAAADLMSPFGGETAPNFAEIRILEDRVSIALEMDLADYPLFVEGGDKDPRPLSQRTGRTIEISADGVPLQPVVHKVDVRDRTPRVSATRQVNVRGRRERSKQVVFAELDYRFEGQPHTIMITPPLDADGMPMASIGMLVEHKGVPVTDYRYLSQRETLKVDWDDPWFSRFENPNLTRHHKSPLMSFISIEPREIRHEIIFRLRDLDNWTDLGPDGSDKLAANDLSEVKRQAAAFFAKHNPLRVNSDIQMPSRSQVTALKVGVSGLQILEDVQEVDRSTALFGIILFYPQDALPQELAMSWELFPSDVTTIPVTVTDPAGSVPDRATVEEPTITWKNYLKQWVEPATKPVAVSDQTSPYWKRLLASIGLSDRIPDAQQAESIMSAMFDNISAAIVETSQQNFEAALGPFVQSESKDAVAAEIQRGLTVKLPSGALGRIDSIGQLQVEKITKVNDGAEILASWTAELSGGHWGHLHRRSIQYRGLFDVIEQGGFWTLRDLTILSAKEPQS